MDHVYFIASFQKSQVYRNKMSEFKSEWRTLGLTIAIHGVIGIKIHIVFNGIIFVIIGIIVGII